MLNKNELVCKLAEALKHSKASANEIYTVFMGIISAALKAEESVIMCGIGTLKCVERKPTTRFNPQTKKKIDVPARKTVTFKVSPTFKKELN